MYKLFTIEEATDLIPVVEPTLDEMQNAISESFRLRAELKNLAPLSIKARNIVQEISFLNHVIHENKAQLDRLGVLLSDIDTGLVDFPSQLGAEVVCLTWEKGQDEITHYHKLNEGTKLPLADVQQVTNFDTK